MDNLINLGSKALKQYSDSNNQSSHSQGGESNGHGVTGGAHLNQPAGGKMIDTDGDGIPDFMEAAQHAKAEAGDSADASLFSNAMSFLKNRDKNDTEIDESSATDAHDRAYNQGQGNSLDAKSMGAAAALQAFKQFTSGGGNTGASAGASASGGGSSKLIGLAMAQAAKLFDKSGGAASGEKQDAVNSAGNMIMKLVMKEKMNQMIGGGNSGGLSGLASMAGKFM